jgi:hypothetical protein
MSAKVYDVIAENIVTRYFFFYLLHTFALFLHV